MAKKTGAVLERLNKEIEELEDKSTKLWNFIHGDSFLKFVETEEERTLMVFQLHAMEAYLYILKKRKEL